MKKSFKKHKNLLRKYPPILEIKLSNEMLTEEVMYKIKKNLGGLIKNWKVFIIPISSMEAQILEEIGKSNLDKFKEDWNNLLATGAISTPIFSLEKIGENEYRAKPFYFLKIHSVFDIGIEEYEKKLKKLIDLIFLKDVGTSEIINN